MARDPQTASKPPRHVQLTSIASIGLSLLALTVWDMTGFIVVAGAGIFLTYGLWNRALANPDSTPLFALKLLAALGVVAAVIWLVVRLVETVEPFWLGLVLAFSLLIGTLVVARRFDRWDSERVSRILARDD